MPNLLHRAKDTKGATLMHSPYGILVIHQNKSKVLMVPHILVKQSITDFKSAWHLAKKSEKQASSIGSPSLLAKKLFTQI